MTPHIPVSLWVSAVTNYLLFASIGVSCDDPLLVCRSPVVFKFPVIPMSPVVPMSPALHLARQGEKYSCQKNSWLFYIYSRLKMTNSM